MTKISTTKFSPLTLPLSPLETVLQQGAGRKSEVVPGRSKNWPGDREAGEEALDLPARSA